MILITQRVRKLNHLTSKFISKYKKYAPNKTELAYANYFHFYEKNILSRKIDVDSLKYQLEIIKESKCLFCEVQFYQRIASVYKLWEKKNDSSLFYNIKALGIIKDNNSYDCYLQLKKGILNNIGRIYLDDKDYSLAIDYFNKAVSIPSAKDRLLNDQIILDNISLTYENLNDFERALFYNKESAKKADEFAEKEHLFEIRKLEELYKNAELRERNLIIEKENSDRRSLNIILSVISIGVITIFFLVYRALKRKQQLIQQEKNLILKEQELHSIDAMIEGQEKERQRIANELHDDLGGLLATLKLYVQNLKIKKTKLNKQHDTIIKNTDAVLEETYQKVRSIAQTRNAGVLASEGLIPTIQNYATKVSASNSLIVEVEAYGMEQRLNNTTEITVFRIIQELITNVIKHAKAKEIIIHITNHQESINIMVEDDGIGFDSNKVELNKGMGLNSIRKRVESLRGNLNIDSQLNRGTTIIIDIPIE